MYSGTGAPKGRFPHSEISGSKPVCWLPEAYRKLLRPSSPPIAKASTTHTYLLDCVASNNLLRFVEVHAANNFQRYLKRFRYFLQCLDCVKNTCGKMRRGQADTVFTRKKRSDFTRLEPRRIELPTSCMQSRRSPE